MRPTAIVVMRTGSWSTALPEFGVGAGLARVRARTTTTVGPPRYPRVVTLRERTRDARPPATADSRSSRVNLNGRLRGHARATVRHAVRVSIAPDGRDATINRSTSVRRPLEAFGRNPMLRRIELASVLWNV